MAKKAVDGMNDQELQGRNIRVDLANEKGAGGDRGERRSFGGDRRGGFRGGRGGGRGRGSFGGGRDDRRGGDRYGGDRDGGRRSGPYDRSEGGGRRDFD
ncbi:hypothetical protein HDU76_008399 [Blyttiomyces sp. JEL0837]|nr:hypothetical protein HDU76_008399 [Blyttiomyces sp. JEL0837]